jgi:hypothetical protein
MTCELTDEFEELTTRKDVGLAAYIAAFIKFCKRTSVGRSSESHPRPYATSNMDIPAIL